MNSGLQSALSKTLEFVLPGNLEKLYVIKQVLPWKWKKIHKTKAKLQRLCDKHFARVHSNIFYSCPIGGYTEVYGPSCKYKKCKNLNEMLNKSNDRRIKAEDKIAKTKFKYNKLITKAYADALYSRWLSQAM